MGLEAKDVILTSEPTVSLSVFRLLRDAVHGTAQGPQRVHGNLRFNPLCSAEQLSEFRKLLASQPQ